MRTLEARVGVSLLGDVGEVGVLGELGATEMGLNFSTGEHTVGAMPVTPAHVASQAKKTPECLAAEDYAATSR